MGDLRAVIETTTTRLEIYNPPSNFQQQTIIRFTEEQKARINRPGDLYPIVWAILRREDENSRSKEHFWVVGLQNDNRILYIELVSLGSTRAAHVNPTEVYQRAVINKPPRIILAHNHPDGITEPSEMDKAITKRLIEAGRLLKIDVLDHLILSENGYYSFYEQGLIEHSEAWEAAGTGKD
uniref:DNA repair protein radc n=1 Tax=Candidatus Kentrum sp. DK TaxID=2126562 RepID=A0A450TAV1_9GAMM|nr:MAG: DNA repair protein radc [Candidatus Kentron sp. DK]